MNKIKAMLQCAVFIVLSACSDSNETNKPHEVLFQGMTMGTVAYNVKVIVKPDTLQGSKFDQPKTHADIDAILKQLLQGMSNWLPDSELSRFNKSTSLATIEVSEGLRRVIAESIRLGKLSEGKLDVTIGPLINLWGFGPEYRPEKVPSDAELKIAQARTGLKYLSLNGNKLSKAIPDLYIDLSTIAKGYAVDLIAEYLESKGLDNYLVEIGGEMRVKGFKHTGELWHVAIEKPLSEERVVHQIIIPKDNALATSGDYRKYFEANGQRFSHIIDPQSGRPINHKLVSVTVIHPSSMTADGLSTAMMLMGEEKALAFAEQNELAAYLIIKTEHGFIEQSTVKFMQYLK
ncbi:MAG: FAD:protein FMN transferase [Colwellia sp.]|nr:FAD:protein FMN transferase [Colwellia sp.]